MSINYYIYDKMNLGVIIMSLIEQLNNQDLFTRTELEIINFIKENPHLIATMSIGQLANETYSSNASIIRICKKLGFNGYKDFKIEYLRNTESKKYLHDDIDFSFPFRGDEPTLKVINSISSVYKDTIDLINSELNLQDLEAIVDILDKSDRVFIYAVGDSMITAMNFTNKLIKINKFFQIATQNHEEVSFSNFVTNKDCCFFISYNSTNFYLRLLKIILPKNCKIITLTANKNDPLYKYSDYTILIPHKEKNEKIATFYSQLSFQYVLSIIYSLLYKKYKKNNQLKQ